LAILGESETGMPMRYPSPRAAPARAVSFRTAGVRRGTGRRDSPRRTAVRDIAAALNLDAATVERRIDAMIGRLRLEAPEFEP
jgi:hypothetical protein